MSLCQVIYDILNFDIECDYRLKRRTSDVNDLKEPLMDEDVVIDSPWTQNHIDTRFDVVNKLVKSYATQYMKK